ncbi:MAG TPA: DUF2191 domain-containing protein [Leptospiraceae bacterium]|nr:DUF2191 domain-containing protein [Leptospiraceae bacterium]HMW06755.1 DUF2191 domain-containing protein [Leptospiraceae bacterium]HMX33306.1 DUF2191 domain-containing protein [Leptospiraceae bacterium]HMY32061.1 DUF2191 domain-containing protein [Leptospiraceae bacterium]HMZ63984.1 DUF2191 domain-containing protein [Leptospiraceae bacterium]
MKVTAILPDQLINDVKEFSGGKNITESIEKALSEWIKLAKLKRLNKTIQEKPLSFRDGFSAEKVRKLNRSNK